MRRSERAWRSSTGVKAYRVMYPAPGFKEKQTA